MATISSLLADHVTLEVHSVDRLFVQGYVPRLMTAGQVIRFLLDRGFPIPSPSVLGLRAPWLMGHPMWCWSLDHRRGRAILCLPLEGHEETSSPRCLGSAYAQARRHPQDSQGSRALRLQRHRQAGAEDHRHQGCTGDHANLGREAVAMTIRD